MDYGIRWDSDPESPLSLSEHDTSSFHHVPPRGGRWPGILQHTPCASILPRGVHGDLSQCLRSRVFRAPLPSWVLRSCGVSRAGIPIPSNVDSATLYHANLDPGHPDKASALPRRRALAFLGNRGIFNVIDSMSFHNYL